MKNSVLLHIAGVAAVTLLCACGGEDKKEAKHVAQADMPVQVAENAVPADAVAQAPAPDAPAPDASAPAAQATPAPDASAPAAPATPAPDASAPAAPAA